MSQLLNYYIMKQRISWNTCLLIQIIQKAISLESYDDDAIFFIYASKLL